MARTAASARPLTDHDEIRRWAEERNAKPSCVRNTGSGDDVGMIRLDFPGFAGGDSLDEVSWDDWFRKFDENRLALLVQDETAGGRKSNFNKLVKRETAEKEKRNRAPASRPARSIASRRRAGSGRSMSRNSAPRSSRKSVTAKRSPSNKGSARKSRSRTAAVGKRSAASARGQSRRGSSGRRAA